MPRSASVSENFDLKEGINVAQAPKIIPSTRKNNDAAMRGLDDVAGPHPAERASVSAVV
jgi:hypothetical protein